MLLAYSRSGSARVFLDIPDGTLEAVKWLALLLMLADHINKYVLNSMYAAIFDAGRLAMPLFVMVFGINLARANIDYKRIIKRLFFFGVLSTPPFIAVGGTWAGWWPLNILFTLLAITIIVFCYDKHSEQLAFFVFLLSGFFVEFFHPALIIGLGAWAYWKKPSIAASIAVVFGLSLLWVVNRNFWALVALPLLIGLGRVNFGLKRNKWLFYGFYPAHLSLIWMLFE